MSVSETGEHHRGGAAPRNLQFPLFFHDCIAFLLFATEDKPFPFKSTDTVNENTEEAEIIEAEVDSTNSDEDEPSEVEEEKDK